MLNLPSKVGVELEGAGLTALQDVHYSFFFYLFVCFSKLTYKRYLKGILAGAECCLSHTSLLDEKEIKM